MTPNGPQVASSEPLLEGISSLPVTPLRPTMPAPPSSRKEEEHGLSTEDKRPGA